MAYFTWDVKKEAVNLLKHGVDFGTAARVFEDPHRQILYDSKHSGGEVRYFCLGKIGHRVLTVHFIYRYDVIRIIGAGYWRKGRRIYYEEEKA